MRSKKIYFTQHALEQCRERGASKEEVIDAIHNGIEEPAKKNRIQKKLNIQYDNYWNDVFYSVKQVAPIIVEEDTEITVITVYTFYF